MQATVIGVKFQNAGKIFDFVTNGLFPNIGDKVVVETTRGLSIGTVATTMREVSFQSLEQQLANVVRIATGADISKKQSFAVRERQIARETKQIAKQYGLDMKIVDAEISLDETKIVINFTSENRVDFRDLVKELGSRFKNRIELRQIGARDEVKEIGGIGPCGKVCCCNDFLVDFEKVTIKMPKVQGLSLNPAKISGQCGRLMCCLAYENGHYSETSKLMPRIGSVVETPNGKGTVVFNNLLKREVQVRIGERGEQGSELTFFPLEEIKRIGVASIDGDTQPADEE